MKTKILILTIVALVVAFTSCNKDLDDPIFHPKTDSIPNIDSIPDSTGTTGGTATYQLLTGDQMFITVSRNDSMGIGGLVFQFVTEKKYPCVNHHLIYDNFVTDQGFKLVFNSVLIPPSENCEPGETVAESSTVWYPISDGSHEIAVVLNGVTYTGSFVKAGSGYTFTWPYRSGVILTPLILN